MASTIAFLLLIIASILLALALHLRRKTGLPWLRVVASDADAGRPLEKPLFAARYRLTGKPDYLLKRGAVTIPVEVKPARHATEPYESDLMQLAAYCLLVEETTGYAPPYGLLRYAETTFRLTYTPAVREKLLDILDEMQEALDAADCDRSHEEPPRCRGCGFADICEQSLWPEL